MRKVSAIIAALAIVAPTAALASESYVIRMTVLNAKGVQSYDVNNGARYSSLTECQLRKQAWERESLAGYESAVDSLRKQGQAAELNVDCLALN